MEQLGYRNYYQVLNAKDYGIPQNRERVFTISIRKDLNTLFEFPIKQELKIKLKDMLEEEVDEKYYLSDKMLNYIVADNEKQTGNNSKSVINKKIASAINTGEEQRRCDASNYVSDNFNEDYNLKQLLCNKLIKENKVKESDVIRHSYSSSRMKNMYTQNSKNNNISPTLDTRCDCLGVCVKIKNNTKKGYLEAYPGDGIYTNTSTKRGTVQSQTIQTITTFQDKGVVLEDLRIRKLTPKECWRLMGFDDSDYEKASKVNSNAQLYKQAGNSIVVNVLEAIFKELLGGKNEEESI
jgi:DNA (cytosine-5)-methyltransferase 1